MFSVVWFCDEGVVTGDRCNSRMRARPNRLSVLKKFAQLIGFACCLSRPGACGGLWTRQMLLVCSTYVSVLYFVRFAEKKAEKSPKRPKASLHHRTVIITDNMER